MPGRATWSFVGLAFAIAIIAAWLSDEANKAPRNPPAVILRVNIADVTIANSPCHRTIDTIIERLDFDPGYRTLAFRPYSTFAVEPTPNPLITRLRPPPDFPYSPPMILEVSTKLVSHYGGEPIISVSLKDFASFRIQLAGGMATYFVVSYDCLYSDVETLLPTIISAASRAITR